jgi:hypothetical protein
MPSDPGRMTPAEMADWCEEESRWQSGNGYPTAAEKLRDIAALLRSLPPPPPADACNCWIGRGDLGGDSLIRSRCPVHGDKADAAATIRRLAGRGRAT